MTRLIPDALALRAFAPEITLLATVAAVLAVPLAGVKRNGLWVGLAAFVGTSAAAYALLAAAGFPGTGGPELMPGGFYFGNLLLMDPAAWFFKLVLLLFVLIVVAMWMVDRRARACSPDLAAAHEAGGLAGSAEFFVLLLSATVGLSLLGSTTHLLMIFMALELASLPSYALAGFRKGRRGGAEAALKYVLFGAVAAAVMLYGMSFLYGATGAMELSRIAAAAGPGNRLMLTVGVVALLAGAAFKVGAVPMHFWCPDVFEGAEYDVAAFLSVASKAGGLILLLRVLNAFADAPGFAWLLPAVMVIGAVTCFWGNLAALGQDNIKRLLAYSSIAHAGYMIIGLSVLDRPPAGFRDPAAETLLFYLFGYLFINGGIFATAAVIARATGSQTVGGYANLGRRAPLLALAMLLFLISLTGIPLTIGFGVKLKLFVMLYNAATPLTLCVGIPAVGLNTVIAAFYYFRVIRQMYLAPDPAARDPKHQPEAVGIARIGAPALALIALLAFANVALFVGYGWLDSRARAFAQMSTEVGTARE